MLSDLVSSPIFIIRVAISFLIIVFFWKERGCLFLIILFISVIQVIIYLVAIISLIFNIDISLEL